MTRDVRERISAFLGQFVEMAEGDYSIPRDDADFVSAIELLILENVFTKAELRQECLHDYSVIIPEYLFGVYAEQYDCDKNSPKVTLSGLKKKNESLFVMEGVEKKTWQFIPRDRSSEETFITLVMMEQ